jgi:hypothetical protein
MHRIDAFNTFQFDDDQIFNQEVDTVTKVDPLAIVHDGKLNLSGDLQPFLP